MTVLYEDSALIVCEKPIGLLSQKGKEGEETMLTRLDAHFAQKGESARAFVLHRLDREVGGVMVYAKNAQSAAGISAQIASGDMEKTYLAVCHGDVTASLGEQGRLVDLLFHDASKNKSYVTKRLRRGVKEARLTYRLLGRNKSKEDSLSLLRVTLETGRTHQIRVQLSSRGHSLVGDARYGSRERGAELALFSQEIAFRHPIGGKQMRFSLTIPKGYPWDLFDEEKAL